MANPGQFAAVLGTADHVCGLKYGNFGGNYPGKRSETLSGYPRRKEGQVTAVT